MWQKAPAWGMTKAMAGDNRPGALAEFSKPSARRQSPRLWLRRASWWTASPREAAVGRKHARLTCRLSCVRKGRPWYCFGELIELNSFRFNCFAVQISLAMSLASCNVVNHPSKKPLRGFTPRSRRFARLRSPTDLVPPDTISNAHAPCRHERAKYALAWPE